MSKILPHIINQEFLYLYCQQNNKHDITSYSSRIAGSKRQN